MLKLKDVIKKKWKPFYVSQDLYLLYRPNELKVLLEPEEKEKVLKKCLKMIITASVQELVCSTMLFVKNINYTKK